MSYSATPNCQLQTMSGGMAWSLYHIDVFKSCNKCWRTFKTQAPWMNVSWTAELFRLNAVNLNYRIFTVVNHLQSSFWFSSVSVLLTMPQVDWESLHRSLLVSLEELKEEFWLLYCDRGKIHPIKSFGSLNFPEVPSDSQMKYIPPTVVYKHFPGGVRSHNVSLRWWASDVLLVIMGWNEKSLYLPHVLKYERNCTISCLSQKLRLRPRKKNKKVYRKTTPPWAELHVNVKAGRYDVWPLRWHCRCRKLQTFADVTTKSSAHLMHRST